MKELREMSSFLQARLYQIFGCYTYVGRCTRAPSFWSSASNVIQKFVN